MNWIRLTKLWKESQRYWADLLADMNFTKCNPDFDSFTKSFNTFILSASGYRKVFAADGDEESSTAEISPEDTAAAAIIASEFADFIKSRHGKTVSLGTDARPTGKAIAGVTAAIFLTKGLNVLYSGITAAPEHMAWTKTDPSIDAFAYISASHNPIGHNGFKFGLSDGAVIGGAGSAELIAKIRKAAADSAALDEICRLLGRVSGAAVDAVFDSEKANKIMAEKAYREFSLEVITSKAEGSERDEIIDKLKSSAGSIGIIAELNGSARGVSIDKEFFGSFGLSSRFLNDTPGKIVHRIVPEGASLNLCRDELEKAHARDKRFIMGYVPDNDGDRGNIVYFSDISGRAELLEAQEVFALSVKAELSFARRLNPSARLAVAVNGPTSMRIEEIATEYKAEVFRAEVGEANVVNLAAEKRAEGYEVRILGEGSNGGNITHPATVRDPLNTVFAIIKLLSLDGYKSISDAVKSLPSYTTTSAYEPEARMNIGNITHSELKANYEAVLQKEFPEKSEWLKRKFGIYSWDEVNYEGTRAVPGTGKEYRSGAETGGLKINLRDKNNKPLAYLWMRGSGTEPVFRVMTDIKGNDPEGMRELLDWHRRMVADSAKI